MKKKATHKKKIWADPYSIDRTPECFARAQYIIIIVYKLLELGPLWQLISTKRMECANFFFDPMKHLPQCAAAFSISD